MIFECLGWCTLNFGWFIGILDGLFCILDGSFWGWVLSDWDGVIGILDCDYVILDNYLRFEGENLVFLIVYLVF